MTSGLVFHEVLFGTDASSPPGDKYRESSRTIEPGSEIRQHLSDAGDLEEFSCFGRRDSSGGQVGLRETFSHVHDFSTWEVASGSTTPHFDRHTARRCILGTQILDDVTVPEGNIEPSWLIQSEEALSSDVLSDTAFSPSLFTSHDRPRLGAREVHQ